ncbi:MAG: response regulator [Deltaproteobacteria bacterium]|nr:MAG: response regulator [Deltaproteobacteria bacterium]TMQ06726.1 MAG: response regulator [Deltaproteobacteria bacterium]
MEDRVDTRRLLLIDDSEIALAYAESVLTDAGFEVRAVGSLRTFQTVLASWRPHLIVTDLYMPEMNGAELCQWLRREVATARIPIVLCSSAPDQELAVVARAVGADAYVSKVDGLDSLPDRLNALCDEILW